ncbi:MAG: ATP-binding cassette domain-containing protein [Caldilineaceae bacterium]|nr:ATP-binding cassette domain-containing protein [Caldilineaceae bacterium]
MAESFIFCENLVKIYKVAELEQVALQGLHLNIERGELVGIIGSSGSGKTTLMSILGGLDRPTAGKVLVNGQDLLRMPDRQLNRYRREQVGFVWQQSARNLVPYLNAIQNVMLPMTLAGASGQSNRKYAEELLDIVGLAERKNHYLPELSGGEQQRVAIAVALANNPILLLADEPTGEVDSNTAQVIYGTFQMLAHELGVTTLIVSHDPTIAKHVDRVVMIRDGMLASETRRQVRAQGDETAAENGAGEQHEEEYEELVVLDKAGRIHIPHDYLEQFNFGQRVRIEATEDGIVIRPALAHNGEANGAADEISDDADDMDELEAAPAKAGRIRGLFGRFGRKNSAGDEE